MSHIQVIKILKTNESIYIPVNTKHRLENEKKKELKIIEIQFGELISEDDIVRYQDIYKRKVVDAS